jgi:peptidylprolyl isomerase
VRPPTRVPRVNRRSTAAALTLVLPLTLAGCWAQTEGTASPNPTATATAPPTATASAPSPGASVAPFEHNGVTVTGPLGAEPTITLADDFEAVKDLDVADVVAGTGAAVAADSTVTAHYVGMGQKTRQVFDSSWSTEPATFDLATVIPGFGAGMLGMKVGGRRLMIIPASMAYGETGNPPAIEPNETLVFVVDLVAVS